MYHYFSDKSLALLDQVPTLVCRDYTVILDHLQNIVGSEERRSFLVELWRGNSKLYDACRKKCPALDAVRLLQPKLLKFAENLPTILEEEGYHAGYKKLKSLNVDFNSKKQILELIRECDEDFYTYYNILFNRRKRRQEFVAEQKKIREERRVKEFWEHWTLDRICEEVKKINAGFCGVLVEDVLYYKELDFKETVEALLQKFFTMHTSPASYSGVMMFRQFFSYCRNYKERLIGGFDRFDQGDDSLASTLYIFESTERQKDYMASFSGRLLKSMEEKRKQYEAKGFKRFDMDSFKSEG